MLGKTRGIVLHAIPYSDVYSIVHIYTEQYGRVAYLAPRGRGKKSSVSRALFMPLALLDMEVYHQPKREVQRVREAKPSPPLTGIPSDPIKNALALFLSEVLFRTLRLPTPDPPLFHFLAQSVLCLEEAAKGTANFHLAFLLALPRFLGIAPDLGTYAKGCFFDLRNGIFTPTPPLHAHFLDRRESRFFAALSRINYANMALYTFSQAERRAILEQILDYYGLHVPGFFPLKSLPVLQALFS
ncbi:MAG: DNA repair protein RecO [Tannerella sp.]|jgi:DNA repair protein RecO (recombination protein O)|nr:DNA repair protein RecO [Tannerella sp.]